MRATYELQVRSTFDASPVPPGSACPKPTRRDACDVRAANSGARKDVVRCAAAHPGELTRRFSPGPNPGPRQVLERTHAHVACEFASHRDAIALATMQPVRPTIRPADSKPGGTSFSVGRRRRAYSCYATAAMSKTIVAATLTWSRLSYGCLVSGVA